MMENKENKTLVTYFSSFLLYEILCYLANAMIMPSMLNVAKYLHAGESDISMTVIAYMIGLTIVPIFISPIAGLIGKPKVIVIGCCIFAVSNLLCPFSTDIKLFSIFRLLQGVGQGFIFLGYTMVHELCDDIRAVKMTALMGNITITAPILGPILGSLLAVYLGWKYIFWLTGGFAILALLGLIIKKPTIYFIPEKINPKIIFMRYKSIVLHKRFLLGVVVLTLAMIPSEFWMIFSVIIVRDTLGFSLLLYNLYMIIVVSSSIISFIFLNKLIHKLSFLKLVVIGCLINFLGALLSIVTYPFPFIFVICVAISVFGGGLFRGIIYRQLITRVHQDKNSVSALCNLVSSFILIVCICVANVIFNYTHYSLFSLGLFSFFVSVACFIFALYFMRTLVKIAYQ